MASIDERKNIRRAFLIGTLALALLVVFVIFGLPSIAKFAAFLNEIRNTNSPVTINDTTPPAPPKLSVDDDYTNKKSVDITGTSEDGATITLFLNDSERELIADSSGHFLAEFKLKDGENTARAIATDAAGNESNESKELIIIRDDTSPDLEIISPNDGEEFFGSRQRQVTIEGTTELGASVTINDRLIVVDSAGNFTFTTSLADGENIFNAKATDKAENETEISITLHFTP